jgi:hypothetical protein
MDIQSVVVKVNTVGHSTLPTGALRFVDGKLLQEVRIIQHQETEAHPIGIRKEWIESVEDFTKEMILFAQKTLETSSS